MFPQPYAIGCLQQLVYNPFAETASQQKIMSFCCLSFLFIIFVSFQLTSALNSTIHWVHNHLLQVTKNSSEGQLLQIMFLTPDEGLKVILLRSGSSGREFKLTVDAKCKFPSFCDPYENSNHSNCTFPRTFDKVDYFQYICPNSPGRGCCFVVDAPSASNSTKDFYKLVDFGKLSFYSAFFPTEAVTGIHDISTCRNACMKNSTCVAAFYTAKVIGARPLFLCYLPSVVFAGVPSGKPTSHFLASIKILAVNYSDHIPDFTPPPTSYDNDDDRDINLKSSSFSMIMKASVITLSVTILAIVSCVIWWKYRRTKWSNHNFLDQVLGGPIQFSYNELSQATKKFVTMLGRGGFGIVYKGKLKNNTLIAVKRLYSIEQGMEEFLVEMKTMGSIRHINLVKLLGFCADESNRLLVYEYMSKGSLDQWIFNEKKKKELNWEKRRSIVLQVAKGLAYLHEECDQMIAHLDMKPHNILLDEDFSAKISDFGLARFIDRDQSHVITGMKGTIGYLAPEWKHSRITVKVDVYSFGIVLLEVVSGRMVLDYSQKDADVILLRVLQRKASEGRLVDIIDKKIADWKSHEEDMVLMITVGAWCLCEDPAKRPSMSTLVKIFEGTMKLEHEIDFNFAHVLVLSSK